MNFEKKNNIYKTTMVVLITAIITFIITSVLMYNYMQLNENTSIISKIEDKIKFVKTYLENNYLGEMNEEKMLEYAIKGYVAGIGDEYTAYLTKDEYEDLMINVNGNYVGIGVYITQDRYGNTIVLLPIEGSPAEQADLRTGDIILKINGEECANQELDAIVNKIKGEEGSTVEIEIQRDKEILTKTIERKNVEINQVESKILENNIGYIQILSFDDGSSKEFEVKLDELINKGIKHLIIDVRDNGGGIVEEAEEISNLFLDKNNIIMIEINKNGNEEITKAEEDKKISTDMSIIILTNENTASAAEIFVGALKENGVAKVVGERTFGKGVMQEIAPLPDGGALKLTIEEFKTPNGNEINKKGIEPDIEIEENNYTETDEQLQKAIETLK